LTLFANSFLTKTPCTPIPVQDLMNIYPDIYQTQKETAGVKDVVGKKSRDSLAEDDEGDVTDDDIQKTRKHSKKK